MRSAIFLSMVLVALVLPNVSCAAEVPETAAEAAEQLYATVIEPRLHREFVGDMARDIGQSVLASPQARDFLAKRGITECKVLDEAVAKYSADGLRLLLEDVYRNSSLHEDIVALLTQSYTFKELRTKAMLFGSMQGGENVFFMTENNSAFMAGLEPIIKNYSAAFFQNPSYSGRLKASIQEKIHPVLEQCR